jgi:NDP-sugar pyrophosphorylase family protein
MAELALIMPMAGQGSRFLRAGVVTPKPLIEIGGRPFFWWAVESVRRAAPLREMVFVVLAEHVRAFGIDTAIRRYYPDARILELDAVTAGAAETAALGIAALSLDGPIAINDCDHAFSAPGLPALHEALEAGAAGALVGFASSNPAYSFVRLAPDAPWQVLGAVEKRCVGPYAIAGCYLFRDKATFAHAYVGYGEACDEAELFVSGLYNRLCDLGETVIFQPLAAHLPFGTPDEADLVSTSALAGLIDVATA